MRGWSRDGVRPAEQDCIQVVFAFPELIADLEGWLASRGTRLFAIPLEGEDELPTYAITTIGGRP